MRIVMSSLTGHSTLIEGTSIVFVFLLLLFDVSGSDYYCKEGQTSEIQLNNQNGTIHTLLEGEEFYGDNQYCRWTLDAGSDTQRIHLRILSTDLQWAPESAICTGGYDYVHVKDGDSTESDTIVLWCGKRNPRSIISTGRYLTIIFQSNPQNQYKYSYRGVSIAFRSFDEGTCPPEWTSLTTSDPYCYKVMTHAEKWMNAQRYCNYNQANLATILNLQQQNFLKDIGKSATGSSSGWIGLNKIASESDWVWIDRTEMSTSYFATQDALPDEDCVLVDFESGDWQAADCSRVLSPFVCEAKKSGKTTLYQVPVGTREIESQSNIAIILAGVLGSLVVIGGIIAAILIYLKCVVKKRQARKQNYSAANSRNEPEQQPVSSTPPRSSVPLAPSAPADDDVMGTQLMFLNARIDPASLIAPPTYDEAVGQKGPVDL